MTVGFAVLVGCSGTALGVFQVRSVDCATPNSPMIVTGTLYQATDHGTTGPGPISIDAAPQLAFDSYVAIDTQPSDGGDPAIKHDGFQANPGDLSIIGNPFATAGQINGLWFMDPASPRPEVPAVAQAILSGANGIFLGRFSFRTTDGSTPSGNLQLGPGGMSIEIADLGTENVGSPLTNSLLVRFNAFDADVAEGLDGGSLTTHPMGGTYRLIKHVTLAGPLPGGTARWEVHDLYIVEVPSPASGSLLILGACVVARRRRTCWGA